MSVDAAHTAFVLGGGAVLGACEVGMLINHAVRLPVIHPHVRACPPRTRVSAAN